MKTHCRCDLPTRSSLIRVNSFIIEFNLFILKKWLFVHPAIFSSGLLYMPCAKGPRHTDIRTDNRLAVGFCPVGLCPVRFCPSGLLSQWAFVPSLIE